MTVVDLVGIEPTTSTMPFVSPRQLCDDLLHKLPVGVSFSKSPHILELSRASRTLS